MAHRQKPERGSQPVQGYPSIQLVDLLQLVGRCAGGFVKGPGSFDFHRVLQDWFGRLARRTGSDNLVLNLYFKKFLVVTGRGLSEHILKQPPDVESYVEGMTKARAMSFLAPHALTIAHGEQWLRLRRFNEAVLHTKAADARMPLILDGVRKAFPGPVSDLGDIRKCMAEVMRRVVCGHDRAPEHLAEDMQTLIGYVNNPVSRILAGWIAAGRRKRLYDALGRLWRETPASAPGLIATAKRIAHNGNLSGEELIHQIPHWMFTFTGSGTDLLARTLGIVASRDEVYERVRAEVMEQGSANCASAILNMEYLESCLLETCRLFPPVTRTFHVAPQGDIFRSVRIPAGVEILHCFTAGQRDLSVDATANDFRPERWLEPGNKAHALYPSLFLGGARDCPGQGLILFVCKAALSVLLRDGRIRSECPALSQDPMPHSFPKRCLQFSTESR